MTKPEDVSAEAWKAAKQATSTLPTAFGWRSATETFARALDAFADAAVKREREACAELARTGYYSSELGSRGTAAAIAQAIRNRSASE